MERFTGWIGTVLGAFVRGFGGKKWTSFVTTVGVVVLVNLGMDEATAAEAVSWIVGAIGAIYMIVQFFYDRELVRSGHKTT